MGYTNAEVASMLAARWLHCVCVCVRQVCVTDSLCRFSDTCHAHTHRFMTCRQPTDSVCNDADRLIGSHSLVFQWAIPAIYHGLNRAKRRDCHGLPHEGLHRSAPALYVSICHGSSVSSYSKGSAKPDCGTMVDLLARTDYSIVSPNQLTHVDKRFVKMDTMTDIIGITLSNKQVTYKLHYQSVICHSFSFLFSKGCAVKYASRHVPTEPLPWLQKLWVDRPRQALRPEIIWIWLK